MRVRWLSRALDDLDEAEAYIARDNPAAASEVVAQIAKTVTLLKEKPGMGRPGRIEGTRELVVPGTPFVVPYRVKEDTIEVLRGVSLLSEMAETLLTHRPTGKRELPLPVEKGAASQRGGTGSRRGTGTI